MWGVRLLIHWSVLQARGAPGQIQTYSRSIATRAKTRGLRGMEVIPYTRLGQSLESMVDALTPVVEFVSLWQ